MYSSAPQPSFDWTRSQMAPQQPPQPDHLQRQQFSTPQYPPQQFQQLSQGPQQFPQPQAAPAEMTGQYYVPQPMPIISANTTYSVPEYSKNYISTTLGYQEYQQMPMPAYVNNPSSSSVAASTSVHSSNSSVSSRPFSPLLSPRSRQNSIYSNHTHPSPAKSPSSYIPSDSPHGSLQETGPSPANSSYQRAESCDNSLPPPTPLSLSAPTTNAPMANIFNAFYTSSFVTILSTIGSILYSSPSIQPILGHSPHSLISSTFSNLIHPEDLEQ